jgi:hypothetical protein
VYKTKQNYSIDIYYNNERLFWKAENKDNVNEWVEYLDKLLTRFEDSRWNVEDLGDTPFEAIEGSDIFNFRKTYLVSKVF